VAKRIQLPLLYLINYMVIQEAQMMLTNRMIRLEVSQGHQT